jgi:hypothetical protein
MPGFFSRYVILNTNNLPDGELDLYRFQKKLSFIEFLVANSFFLAFRQPTSAVRNTMLHQQAAKDSNHSRYGIKVCRDM